MNNSNNYVKNVNGFISEKYDTDLMDYILNIHNGNPKKPDKKYIWDKKKFVSEFCIKIIEIVTELHENDIFHRDLKCEQIFLNFKNNYSNDLEPDISTCVLGDLDDLLIKPDYESLEKCKDIIGTERYFAPEYILSTSYIRDNNYDMSRVNKPYEYFLTGILNRILGWEEVGINLSFNTKHKNYLEIWKKIMTRSPTDKKVDKNDLRELGFRSTQFYFLCSDILNWIINDLKCDFKILTRKNLKCFILGYFYMMSSDSENRSEIDTNKIWGYLNLVSQNKLSDNDFKEFIFLFEKSSFFDEEVKNNIYQKIYEIYNIKILDWCDKNQSPQKSDLWSLGILLYIVIYHQYPYETYACLTEPGFIDFIFNLHLEDSHHYTNFLRHLISPSIERGLENSEYFKKDFLLELFNKSKIISKEKLIEEKEELKQERSRHSIIFNGSKRERYYNNSNSNNPGLKKSKKNRNIIPLKKNRK